MSYGQVRTINREECAEEKHSKREDTAEGRAALYDSPRVLLDMVQPDQRFLSHLTLSVFTGILRFTEESGCPGRSFGPSQGTANLRALQTHILRQCGDRLDP